MSELAPETRLWNLLRGALTTKALGLVADLRVADALGEGPREIGDLAQRVGADPDTLYRLLRALASDGVFAENEPGVFCNTDASALLREKGDRWSEFAHLWGFACYDAIGRLDARRSDADTGFALAFGTDFWSWLADHPDERANFDRAMEGGRVEQADRLAALEWRGDETVVDVGGGSGTLLRLLIDRRPGLHGIVFDLPETERDETQLGDDISFVAGSFFETAPAGDAYVLSKILHDWDDEHAAKILHTIRAAASTGARLLVMDSVVPDGNDPSPVKWLDLLMLALQRGRERSEGDWRALLETSGFQVTSVEDGLIQGQCR
jgi:hypothetical protein